MYCFSYSGSYNNSEVIGISLRKQSVQQISLDAKDEVIINCRSPLQVDGNISKVKLLAVCGKKAKKPAIGFFWFASFAFLTGFFMSVLSLSLHVF